MEWIGIALMGVGTLSSAFGSFMIRRPEWALRMLGNVFIIAIGTTCNIIALEFTPESVLAPMGSLVVFWTHLISPFVEPHHKHTRNWRGTGLVVAGCALVILVAPPMESVDPGNPVLDLCFFVGCIYAILVLSFGTHVHSIWLDGIKPGLMSGLTNTLAKAYVEALDHKHPFSTFYGLAALLFAAVQLSLLNVALQRDSPIRVNAIYMLTSMLAAIFVGGITFAEFQHTTFLHTALFSIGVAMSSAGTWMLTETS